MSFQDIVFTFHIFAEKELELREYTQIQQIKTLDEEISLYKEKTKKLESDHSEAITELKKDHEGKLAEIDEKIRKMMKMKNDEIKKYKQEKALQHQKYQEIEDVLNDINDKIRV